MNCLYLLLYTSLFYVPVKSSLVQYSRHRYIDKEYLISFSFSTSNPWTQVCKSSNLNVGTKETELAELQVIVFYDLTLKRLTVSSFIFFIGATLRTRSHEFCFIESISQKKLLTRSLMETLIRLFSCYYWSPFSWENSSGKTFSFVTELIN